MGGVKCFYGKASYLRDMINREFTVNQGGLELS